MIRRQTVPQVNNIIYNIINNYNAHMIKPFLFSGQILSPRSLLTYFVDLRNYQFSACRPILFHNQIINNIYWRSADYCNDLERRFR